jgi:hypothetical protein
MAELLALGRRAVNASHPAPDATVSPPPLAINDGVGVSSSAGIPRV